MTTQTEERSAETQQEDASMRNSAAEGQMGAYTEAVKSGMYAKKSGLLGKYDNVRLYWEDETTRQVILPHLQKLMKHVWGKMRRLRILDVGCGSADGFELLTGIKHREASLHDREVDLLTPEVLGQYKGVDLNEDLLDQAREIYGDNHKMLFEQGDFTQGVPLAENEKPYDLYFTSFGTMSHHNEDETAIRFLADIAARTEEYAVVICDWLGRYSYEWQTLWTNDVAKNRNMDYVVSYIYEKEEREHRRDELQHLLLRLMSRPECERVVAEASAQAGTEIRPVAFHDRSVFTGRHMDTGDYNPHAQQIRLAVNSLHENNMRTDLDSLVIDYVPRKGFDFMNEYFEHLQACWNTLLRYTQELLGDYDEQAGRFRHEPPSIPASYPAPLRITMERMRRVVEGVGWLTMGLPRENIIEPHLGYSLRHLVNCLQDGRGAAHGLIGVLEIDKRRPRA